MQLETSVHAHSAVVHVLYGFSVTLFGINKDFLTICKNAVNELPIKKFDNRLD